MALRVGEVFAGYRVLRKLGAGGMGAVYLAQHPRLPRRDALKVLAEGPSADGEFRARFLREAELASRLAHPNVVAIYDRGMFEDSLWIAMQYVEGCDAAELAEQGPQALPVERALHIVGAAASGLDAAHAAGLLHRDVKPANILVSPKPGAPDRVLVTDFGIARAAGESATITAAGEVLATLAYAPPEQLNGAALDHRCDVYALGGTLYFLLTGSVPFPRATQAAVMYAHLAEPPPRPSAANPALPPQLDTVIARAMAKDPEDRYPSCGALAADAFAALRGETITDAVPRRGNRRLIAIAAMVFVLALAVGVATWTAYSKSTQPIATTVAPTTSATRTPVADNSGPWGEFGYIIAAFPDLLPNAPFSSGYRGLRCIKSQVNAANLPATVAPDFDALSCNGDGNPLSALTLTCNASHLPFPVVSLTGVTKAGEQQWNRSSGTGRASWGDGRDADGRPQGVLQLVFDSPARTFCNLVAYSYTGSGQTLYERWWPDAPV
ncbi:serine/threonine-protein kinase [Nocardia colli]|uniref:serine/threonine-protein kinase n=1 Tax=Nocardia colli TaxID=2545717 RepID=UPI0035DE77DB